MGLWIAGMAKQTALPATCLPRLLTRLGAAAYVSVSPNVFDEMVAAGRMPKPRRVTVKRIAWDVRELDAAVDEMATVGDAPPDTWGDLRNGHHSGA